MIYWARPVQPSFAELTRTALYGLCEREAAVITTKNIVWVLALGAVWGVAELFGKDLLADFGVGGASIWLAAWAILLLSIGRGLWNKIGSSAIIGLIAAAFKFAGPSTNHCHLLGIAALGVIFDIFASSLLAQGRLQWWRPALVGVLTAFSARAFFVWFSVSVAQSGRWIEGGTQMAIDHVVLGGSVVAVAALLLAPLGFRIGKKAAEALSGSPAEDPLTADHR
jgi:hypothetical protein